MTDTVLDDTTRLIERSRVRGIIMQSQDIDVAQKALLLGEIDALPISTPRDWKSPDTNATAALNEECRASMVEIATLREENERLRASPITGATPDVRGLMEEINRCAYALSGLAIGMAALSLARSDIGAAIEVLEKCRAVLAIRPTDTPCYREDCPRRVIIPKVWSNERKDWFPPHNTKPLPSGEGS